MKVKLIFLFIIIGLVLTFCAEPFKRKSFSQEESEMVTSLKEEIKDNQDEEENYQALGIIYFQKNYIDEAIFYLNKANKINPKNFEVLAWLGAAKAKKGREVSGILSMGKKKVKYVRNGVELLNQAADSDPENPIIRLIRIGTILSIKNRFSFGKLDIADKDLKFLEGHNESFPAEMKGQVLFYKGQYLLIRMEVDSNGDPDSKRKAIKMIEDSLELLKGVNKEDASQYLKTIKRGGE